eukprot:s5735_g11.t1
MQPHKLTRTVETRKSSLSVYAHDERLLRDCIQQQTYLVPRVNVELEGPETKAARCLSSGRVPWLTSRLLAQIVSHVDRQHRFSSLTFACNVLSKPHKDSHNAKGRLNLIVPCSVYQGGESWVQDALGSTALQSAGQVGFLMDTTTPIQFQPEHQHATAPWGGDRLIIIGFHVRNTEKLSRPIQFQPEHQHATAPWGGDRLIIIGFHVRNTEKLSRMDRTALCDLGFQLQD